MLTAPAISSLIMDQTAVTTTITLTEIFLAYSSSALSTECSISSIIKTVTTYIEADPCTSHVSVDCSTITSVVTVTNTLLESNVCSTTCEHSTLGVTHSMSVMDGFRTTYTETQLLETCVQSLTTTLATDMQLAWMMVAIVTTTLAIALITITVITGSLLYRKHHRRIPNQTGDQSRKFVN